MGGGGVGGIPICSFALFSPTQSLPLALVAAAVSHRKLKCQYRTRTSFSDLQEGKSPMFSFSFCVLAFLDYGPNVAIVTCTEEPGTGNPLFLAMGPKMTVPGN